MELTIEQALQQGVAAHKEGKLQEAERLYKAILQAQPAHPDANHNLGLLAVSVNKADVALTLFKAAVEANPKVEQFWLSYINALVKDNQFKDANKAINKAKKKGFNTKNFEALLFQAKVKVDTKEPSQEQLSSLLEHYQNRRYAEAEQLAISITNEYPKHQFGWKVLSAVLRETGRISEAANANQAEVKLCPHNAEAHSNLGNTLRELGRLDEAEANYTQAITLKPDYAIAHYNLGITLKELGRLDEAEASYIKVLALKPDYATAHYNLGITLKELGRLDEAEASYKKAIVLKPDLTDAHSNLGVTLHELGRLDEAAASYAQAIALKPDLAEAHSNLGITLKELGRLDEAEASYTQAIRLKPDFAKAHNNLGFTLQELGRLDEAEASLRQAIVLKPDYAEAYNNMGNALHSKGDPESAKDSYKQAINIDPDYAEANYNMSLVNLSLQDFEAGWSLYDWRWKLTKMVSNPLESSKPLWRPSKKQRVLLWCEQGVGDEIMLASLIPDLYFSSSKLIVLTDKRLIPLFRRSFPDDIDFRPSNEVVSETEYDSQIPMGSVPLHFRQSIDSFKNSAQGWLSASSVKSKNLRSQLLSDDSETLIGISWHSTASKKFKVGNKAIPLNKIAPFLHSSKVKLVSLQYGDVDHEIKKLLIDFGIKVTQVPEIDNMNDIDDLAALISACDEVVSIDNVTAHLAGSLGKQSKILLTSSCNWYWGHGQQNSYWYNSVHLYRQTKIGDWEHVIKQL